MRALRIAAGLAAAMFVTLAMAGPVAAHPGGTDSNGGHRCHTNCGSHGLEQEEYHFHDANGNAIRQGSPTPTTARPAPPVTTGPNAFQMVPAPGAEQPAAAPRPAARRVSTARRQSSGQQVAATGLFVDGLTVLGTLLVLTGMLMVAASRATSVRYFLGGRSYWG